MPSLRYVTPFLPPHTLAASTTSVRSSPSCRATRHRSLPAHLRPGSVMADRTGVLNPQGFSVTTSNSLTTIVDALRGLKPGPSITEKIEILAAMSRWRNCMTRW